MLIVQLGGINGRLRDVQFPSRHQLLLKQVVDAIQLGPRAFQLNLAAAHFEEPTLLV